MGPAPICRSRLINACCFKFQASLFVFSRISWQKHVLHFINVFCFEQISHFIFPRKSWKYTFLLFQASFNFYCLHFPEYQKKERHFFNVCPFKQVSSYKFHLQCFTEYYEKGVSNNKFLLFQASFKFFSLYFPEYNTRSCISLMSAVLSRPVLLKL